MSGSALTLALLDADDPHQPFPDVSVAMRDPDGLLAFGGCLRPQRLLNAYRSGIFPWFNPDQPILWWAPDPRAVLFPDQFHCSRSLRKKLRRHDFEVTTDQDFETVLRACAAPREGEPGTWITEEMHHAYAELHRAGHAHCVEVWMNGELAGGLYGVQLGAVFYGESMFALQPDASKIALACLCANADRLDIRLVDCQARTDHLDSLGAISLPRSEFMAKLDTWCDLDVPAWPAAGSRLDMNLEDWLNRD